MALKLQEKILLKKYTTYKIGGPAKYFFVARNKEDLVNAVKFSKEKKLPVLILGGGSNILISEKGFRGLVIKLDIDSCLFTGNKVFAGAGIWLARLARLAAGTGLSGFEWAVGIPGITVGGAIYGNAQAFGSKIADCLESTEVFDAKNLKFFVLTKKQCQFSLKSSIFKKNKNLIIVSAVFNLKPESPKQIEERMEKNIYHRNTKHPMSFPSAGSVFINPVAVIRNKKLLELHPEIIDFNRAGVLPAGFLIEKTGLAGKKIGGAQISPKHSNFIVNLGGAKAGDVLALINLAKKKVKKKFGIDLETEIQIIK